MSEPVGSNNGNSVHIFMPWLYQSVTTITMIYLHVRCILCLVWLLDYPEAYETGISFLVCSPIPGHVLMSSAPIPLYGNVIAVNLQNVNSTFPPVF